MSEQPLMIEAYLHGQQHREAFQDLTPQQINEMDLGTYARLTGRSLGVQPGSVAVPAPQPPAAGPAEAVAGPAPQAIDVSQMSMEQYAAYRRQIGIGAGRQEGRGIFNSVGSRSQEYTDAARAQAGRTAYSQRNIVEAPRLEGRQLRQGDGVDRRDVSSRFNAPGNSFQI